MFAGTNYSQKQAEMWCPGPLSIAFEGDASKKEIDEFTDSISMYHVQNHWYLETPKIVDHVSRMKSVTPFHYPSSMITNNLIDETLVLLSRAHSNPKIDKSYTRLRDYSRSGVKSKSSGRIVLLETILMPDGEHTSVEAYRRFIQAIQ